VVRGGAWGGRGEGCEETEGVPQISARQEGRRLKLISYTCSWGGLLLASETVDL